MPTFAAPSWRNVSRRPDRLLVRDKRPHVGGNSRSRPDPDTGVEEHVYGLHIFRAAAARRSALVRPLSAVPALSH